MNVIHKKVFDKEKTLPYLYIWLKSVSITKDPKASLLIIISRNYFSSVNQHLNIKKGLKNQYL